jgi:hypothetical protein
MNNVWISRKRALKKEPLTIILPVLGEQTSINYNELVVKTCLHRNIEGLHLEVSPLCNSTTGQCLETAGRNWVRVRPQNIVGLSAESPVRIHLIAEIPQGAIPYELKDGVYEGNLRLFAGTEMLDQAGIKLRVSIPRFIFSKSEIKNPVSKTHVFEKTIYYPGRTEHEFRIPVWSSTLKGIRAVASFEDPEGIEFTNNVKGGKEKYVIYGIRNGIVHVPGKQARKPAYIKAFVKILDNSLNGKDFVNTLFISADKHKQAQVLLTAHIRFIPKQWRWLALSILIIGILVFRSGWNIWKNRAVWTGKTLKFKIAEGTEQHWAVKINEKEILTVKYNGDSLPTDDSKSTGSNLVCFSSEKTMSVNNERQIQGDYYPQPSDEISLSLGGKRMSFFVRQLPIHRSPYLCVKVMRSPFGHGIKAYFLIMLSTCLFMASLLGFFKFYSLLRFFGSIIGF